MNRYCTLLVASALLSAGPWLAAAAQSTTPAPKVTSRTPAASSTNSKSVQLGKVNVNGIRELVRSLQTVKVALKEPFSSSADKANVTVCRFIHGAGHTSAEERMGASLDCGSNSWYTWRKDACHLALMAKEYGNCADGQLTSAAYKRNGAWHSVRYFNLTQLMYLRQLLKKLPPPGSSEKIIVEWSQQNSVKPANNTGSTPPSAVPLR